MITEVPEPPVGTGDAVCGTDLTGVQRVLLEVARATASHRDLQSLLRDLAELLHCFGRFDRVAIVLHDPERDLMRLHTLASVTPALVTDLELPIAESPAGLAWETQQPVVLRSLERETRFATVTRILLNEGMRSACIMPLTSPLRRLGGLSFASRKEDAFGDGEVEVLRELSNQVALAVDNTFHHEAAQRAQHELARERDRLRLLLEVNNAIVSDLEPRRLFTSIATCVRRVVPHDYTSLGVYDPQRNVLDL